MRGAEEVTTGQRYKAYIDYKDSGVDWVGEIPSHWTIERFKNVFIQSNEKNGSSIVGDMLSVSGYRGIEVKEYDDDGRKRTEDELVDYRVVRKGQLVVNTMWLNYAGLGVSDYDGHVSPAYRSYFFLDDTDKKYIHYLLRSTAYVSGYTKYMQGIRPNSLQIKADDFVSFPVVLPSLSEQQAIASFLDHETARIDRLISKQEQLITLLKEKRQAVISHAVTKGLNPDAPMKDSGVEWLGEVPEHWNVGKLKHFWRVIDCKHVTAEFVDDGFRLASIKEVHSKYVNLEMAKQTNEDYYNLLISGGRKPEFGDIIYSRNATVGEAAIVNATEDFALGTRCMYIKI